MGITWSLRKIKRRHIGAFESLKNSDAPGFTYEEVTEKPFDGRKGPPECHGTEKTSCQQNEKRL